MQQTLNFLRIVVHNVTVVFASGTSDAQIKLEFALPMSMRGREGVYILAHALEAINDGLSRMKETVRGCTL
jgi:hypothetical protein